MFSEQGIRKRRRVPNDAASDGMKLISYVGDAGTDRTWRAMIEGPSNHLSDGRIACRVEQALRGPAPPERRQPARRALSILPSVTGRSVLFSFERRVVNMNAGWRGRRWFLGLNASELTSFTRA